MSKRILAVCLVSVMPVLALSAQTRPLLLQPTDPLFGTWVNAAYEGNVRGVAAKAVISADGTELDYRKVADSEPFAAGAFRFEAVWIDANGDHWYKMVWVGDDYPMPLDKPRFKLYVLLRVNAAGNLLDSITGDKAYPKDMKDSSYYGTPLQYRLK